MKRPRDESLAAVEQNVPTVPRDDFLPVGTCDRMVEMAYSVSPSPYAHLKTTHTNSV